jgi:hypothetical protein
MASPKKPPRSRSSRRASAAKSLEAAFSKLSAAALDVERAARELDASDHRRDRVRDLGAVCRVLIVDVGSMSSVLKGASQEVRDV